MSKLSQLLDSNARSRELRAYAYLQARFSTGAESVVDCLMPFVIFAVAQHEGDQFVPEVIAEFLFDNYRIEIPYYTLQGMTGNLERFGALQRDSLSGVLMCKARPEDESESELDLSLDDLAQVESGLDGFARRYDLDGPLASDTWGRALIKFFAPSSDVQEREQRSSAQVRGVLLLHPAQVDERMVAQYITECHERKAPEFETIRKLYYGVLIGDFLANLQTTGDKSAYADLSVIYDATVLMRLIGTSGRILQAATEEMHESLQTLGSRAYYFGHTYNEVLDNIGAVREAIRYGGPLAATSNSPTRGRVKIPHLTAAGR